MMTFLTLLFSLVFAQTASSAQEGVATWYSHRDCHCAASTTFPKGKHLLVSRTDLPLVFVMVRVNDYGPQSKTHRERILDLDKVAFRQLSPLSHGVVPVRVLPLF